MFATRFEFVERYKERKGKGDEGGKVEEGFVYIGGKRNYVNHVEGTEQARKYLTLHSNTYVSVY